jgi:cellulose synthase/poly-beta-1,6-N-acetylglucosamine synthase-like glycosyltransferase
MEYLNYLFSAILIAIFLYFSLTTIYLFTVALAGLIKSPNSNSHNTLQKRIALLIPCYKEDSIIVNTVTSLLNHDYNKNNYKIFVIADSLRPETLTALEAVSCQVVKVSFEVSTKAKSLHATLNHIPAHDFDIALILDADNQLAQGCLKKIAQAFTAGAQAVQCHRIAKNENTPLALLDAINEEINNVLLRRGQWALGFSATASGSGMAFEFNLLKEIFNVPHILQNNGEDKEIDIQLLKRKIKMAYLEEAYVLDEKVSSFGAFKKQRLRWVEAYLNYVFRLFYKDSRTAFKRLDFWNKFFQLVLLPRSLYLIMILTAGIIFIVGAQVEFPFYYPSPWLWLSFTILYSVTLLLCMPLNYANWRTLRSLALLPFILFSMAVTLIKVKPGRKEFIHTPKSFVTTIAEE